MGNLSVLKEEQAVKSIISEGKYYDSVNCAYGYALLIPIKLFGSILKENSCGFIEGGLRNNIAFPMCCII